MALQITMAWMCLLPLFLQCLCFGGVTGQSYANYSTLVSTLLTGYNSDILPLDNHSQTLTLTVSGYFYSLLEVDVVLGKVSVVCSLMVQWTDSQITWTPSEYGNLSNILIPQKKVWSPNVVLGTPVNFDTVGESWMPVAFASDGSANLALGDVISSGCSFNMKFWPFDKQTCDISFAVYGYLFHQLRLQTLTENSLNFLIVNENIEWDVTDGSLFVREDRGMSEVILRITIERQAGIFVILIIFPLYGLAFLSSFVFFLPSEAGERIGFTTTIMLSITVFLEVISDYIPNTSTPIPLLCIVVALGIGMSLLCTAMTILSLYFYHRDSNIPVHGVLVKFVKLLNPKFRKHRVESVDDGIRGENITDYKSSADAKRRLQLSVADIDDKTEEIPGNISEELIVCWKDVSYTVDKMCFAGGTFTHCVVTLCFTLYLTLGTD